MSRYSGLLRGTIYLSIVLISVSGPGNRLWAQESDGFLPAVLISLPGVAGIVIRQKWPHVAYGLILASAVGSFMIGIVVPFMLFLFEACYLTAIRWGIRYRNLIILTVATATICASVLAYTVNGLPFATTMAFIFLIAAWLPTFWGLDIESARRVAKVELARSRCEREAAVAAIQNASDRAELFLAEERMRLASQLHDTVSSRLAAISLQSQAAIADVKEERHQEIIRQIRSEAVTALTEMKHQIDLLTGDTQHTEDSLGVERLNELITRAGHLGQNIQLEGPPLHDLSPKTSRLVYRVIHEGLLNAAKHAPGADVSITWEIRPDAIVIRIINDISAPQALPETEPAMTLLPGNHIGLASLHEQVHAVHGSFEAGANGNHWCISARIPKLPVEKPTTYPHIRSTL